MTSGVSKVVVPVDDRERAIDDGTRYALGRCE
jgi:hypothetical protein